MATSGFGEALDGRPGGPPSDAAPPASDFERLRELLVGDERRALDAARARIGELEAAQQALPRRLPDALEALNSEGEHATARVAGALAEPVAQALGTAVRRNRQSLIEALFPIIGPLIRKSIAEALRNLVADLNGAIESSFSLRGLKWRIEAWRSGAPYAQIVLKHRLAYRIDHVFLIERDSGLVLQRESSPELAPLDADAVAGMLTALGDFVGDSVGQGDGGTLESMSVGEHLVWVVQGPRANLACFMRGVPPAALRALLEQRLEDIHAQWANAPDEELRSARNSIGWHEKLDPMTLLRDATAVDEGTPQRAPSRWPLLVLLLAGLIALTWFVARRERWEARVEALRAQLAAHPGFVLTGIEGRPWRALTVHGLVDQDAEPPATLLAAADLGGVHPLLDANAYVSGDDAVVVRRVTRLLAPPPGVRVAVKQGVLHLDGVAPQAWIDGARERAGWIAGVARAELALKPATDPAQVARAELDALAEKLPQLDVGFLDGAQPAPGADEALGRIAEAARRAQALAQAAHVQIELLGVGTNDETGSDATNARVRALRAQWLVQALAERGIAGIEPEAGAHPADATANRRTAHLRLAVKAPQP